MSVCVNLHMSKIKHTPIKVGVRAYAMYANCQTLPQVKWSVIISNKHGICKLPHELPNNLLRLKILGN